MLPKGAEWIKQSVVSFDPDNNKLTTSEGDEISYEFLVVAMGLQLNYHEVRLVYGLINLSFQLFYWHISLYFLIL